MRPLSRREFFRALVPAWVTRRAVVAVLVIGCVVLIGLELVDVLRAKGFVATAKMAGLLVSVGLAVFLLKKLTLAVGRAIAGASDDFRSFAANLSSLITVAIAMSVGAFLHARWISGEDIAPTLLVIGLIFFVGLFHNGKKG